MKFLNFHASNIIRNINVHKIPKASNALSTKANGWKNFLFSIFHSILSEKKV